MKYSMPEIYTDRRSFEELACFYAHAKECRFENIEIDMAGAGYFEADMCAALGAILYRLGNNPNTVHLTNITEKVKDMLSRNGFLSHYGGEKIPDSLGTAISYRRFDVEDDRHFSNYIESEFSHRSELPAMSPWVAKKFHESIFEIFSNAVLHSRTELGIFSCGQFFPKHERLNLTLADLGVGIFQNVKAHTGQHLSSEEAIVWATEASNTTKPRCDGVPGGLGLKLLREFISLNRGCIQIVSDDGYWQQEKKDVSTATLSCPFPGTVVSVEINTQNADLYVSMARQDSEPKNAGSFAPELSAEDIF